ncbi:hypothetical protein C6P40_002943 [Pichia californica]|uniref:Uncharacterized protein n=1 Tax=Pichia californica TaxID=460514 RepID=A0A9P6WHN9_9ASCO|nr:hypothetical protein C6P42_002728 [[Candida] californica]KAG0687071.1 hypothetical protein C6P40_002943 [[Candida] californica]
MSSNDFKNSVKELDLIIRQNDVEHILTCTMLEFLDKLIVSLALDGETDISYDIQISTMEDMKKPIRRYDFDEEVEEKDDDDSDAADIDQLNSTIIPTVLIGAGNNIKNQVLASQIGHRLKQHLAKNIILNISGKLFGRDSLDEHRPEDSVVVQQCLHLVTETYLS